MKDIENHYRKGENQIKNSIQVIKHPNNRKKVIRNYQRVK